jgi:hypothetical protein
VGILLASDAVRHGGNLLEEAMFIRATGMVVVASALAGLAGCATTMVTRSNLNNDAQNLEYNANALVRDANAPVRGTGYELVRRDDLPDESTRDAHDYARAAQALEARASTSEVQAAFARVSRSYHAVRDEVTRSDSLQARRDFGPVTASYREIEHELGISAGRDEHAPPA